MIIFLCILYKYKYRRQRFSEILASTVVEMFLRVARETPNIGGSVQPVEEEIRHDWLYARDLLVRFRNTATFSDTRSTVCNFIYIYIYI